MSKEIKFRKSWFLFLRIWIPEHKVLSSALNVLFFLPILMPVVRGIMWLVPNKVFKTETISKKELIQLVSLPHVKINIQSHDGIKLKIWTI
jgi:hypothetical protein